MKRTLTTIICTAILAASMTLTASAADAEQTTVTAEEVAVEEVTAVEEETVEAEPTQTERVEIGGEDEKENDAENDAMTEEELREAIMRVAEAVGAYEDDIPAAGKVKEWIMGNLASIVGFFMAISLIIATPIGKKIFGNFIAALKGTMTTAKGWKEEVEAVIARNGEKNAELRASVNEMMSVLKRENEEANRRAKAAESRAAEADEKLIAAEKDAAEQMAKSAAVCEAVCRAVLVMAKPLEMSVQRSKALDEMQKHEIFTEYATAVDAIRDLLSDNNTDGEGEDVAD